VATRDSPGSIEAQANAALDEALASQSTEKHETAPEVGVELLADAATAGVSEAEAVPLAAANTDA
jgi:hypothetical protein